MPMPSNLLSPFPKPQTIRLLLRSLKVADGVRRTAVDQAADAETVLNLGGGREAEHRAETARQNLRQADIARESIISGLLEAAEMEEGS